MQIEASRAGRGSAAALLSALAAGATLAAATRASALDDHAVCVPGQPQIHVTIDGLRSDRGEVVVELYPDDAKQFLGRDKRISRVRQKASPGMVVCMPAAAPAFYALVVYHDENNDGEFNRSKLGIPSEGFGLSNNPSTMFGKPRFTSVRFHVGEGETPIRIRLRYILGGSAPR